MNVKFLYAKPPPPTPSNVYACAAGGVFVAYALSFLLGIDSTRVVDSRNRTDLTVIHDKFFCVGFMYTVHIVFCWCTFLTGLGALLFRLMHKTQFNVMHVWAGRLYILSMLWTVATSSLIRNEGLPLGTIVSFLWVLGGLTLGFILIKIDSSSKWSRIVHGALMFTSFLGIAGRIVNYNMNKEFQCYAQPAFKINGSLIPSQDPSYHKMPWADKEIWGWGLPLAFGPFFATILILSWWI